MLKYVLPLVLCLSATAHAQSVKKLTLTKDNTIVMNTSFDWQSVAKVVQSARELDARLPSKEPIYLLLDSGGGSIEAGIEAIENLSNLNRPVHTLTLFSASMAFQTVQGLGKRLITVNGTMMSHKARGGFSGEFPGQLDSRYSHYLKRVQNLDKQVVKRTKGKHTTASYANLIENEYWCDGNDCIKQGFADMVVKPTCDKSLSGTKTDDESFSFMGIPITIRLVRSACPLNTGVISYEVFVDGQNLYTKPGEYSYSSTKDKLSAIDLKNLEEQIKTRITNLTSRKGVEKY